MSGQVRIRHPIFSLFPSPSTDRFSAAVCFLKSMCGTPLSSRDDKAACLEEGIDELEALAQGRMLRGAVGGTVGGQRFEGVK